MKKINNILIFIFSILSICIFVKDVNLNNTDRFLGDLSIILVFFLPRIFKKIFKLKITGVLEMIYIIFIIIAQFFGSIVNLYNTTWWYDLFAHFLSGVLTGVLALIILKWFNMYKEKNKLFNVLYIISFVLMIAGLWEFLEYGADTFLGLNVQHSIETGVRDTMEDMLIAFLGSIIVGVFYLVESKSQKKGFLKKIVSDKK